ncbi:uracil-DNA glycosylase-like protein, partial [Lyophyllum atratum]
QLKTFLLEEHRLHTVYPPLSDVYSWSALTPLEQVKVVILGQDPYHNDGQAHGLSFSVLPPTKPPGSLKNIYKQLTLDYPGFVPPASGDLTPLAKLGVLWLNTSLTVRAHKAASHANKGWETFTAQVIRTVIERESETRRGIVFMAWGLPAQKACAKLGIDEHLLLKSAHPSPLSAHRGFIGNGHFRLANTWLKEKYGEGSQIDWTVLRQQEMISRMPDDSMYSVHTIYPLYINPVHPLLAGVSEFLHTQS